MEKVKLGDVLLYEQPTKYIVESDRYNYDFEIPVLTAGKSFLLGYTDEKIGIFNDLPVIIFDDFTTAIKFVDFPFKVKSSAMKILKPNKEKADIRYLYYKMLTIKTDSDQHKRYWISKFANIQISLPPLPEQKAIATKLDKAQEIISYNKQLIEKYDQLTQSLFIDMFGDPVRNEKGWAMLNIKKSAEKFCDGPFGSNLKTEHYTSSGVRVIRLNNIGVGDFIDDDKAFISEDYAKVLHKNICLPRDILIGTMGEPNLRVCILPNYIKKAINKADCLIYRPYKKYYNVLFLKYLLNDTSFVNSLSDLILGQTRGRISMGRLSTRSIIAPPLSLQNQFAERIEKIEAQKQMAQESLVKSEALFQSLLQESFK